MHAWYSSHCILGRAYDPADYEHLSVSPEISELFSYITRYTPQAIELEHRLRPYIPDYIPAVGDIDAFIKVCGRVITSVTALSRLWTSCVPNCCVSLNDLELCFFVVCKIQV